MTNACVFVQGTQISPSCTEIKNKKDLETTLRALFTSTFYEHFLRALFTSTFYEHLKICQPDKRTT